MIVVVICEFGGIDLGECLCELVLYYKMYLEIEVLLMFVLCCEYLVQVIELVLVCGDWVILDCFIDVIFVYQGGGCKLVLDKLDSFEQWVYFYL